MERCFSHRKEPVGPCNWCGTKLCSDCIVHQQGNLVYCDKCSSHLRVPTRQRQELSLSTVQMTKRPVLTKDGYLDLTR